MLRQERYTQRRRVKLVTTWCCVGTGDKLKCLQGLQLPSLTLTELSSINQSLLVELILWNHTEKVQHVALV